MRTLYRGGHIYTPEPFANAMLVDGDTVAWIGADEASKSYVDVADEVVELEGAFVAPGFVDAHVHLTAAGLALIGVDLRSATSAADLVQAVDGSSDAHVIGHGWDDTEWTSSPTRHDLDAVARGRIVYLSRVDVHSAVVSTALMDLVPGIEEMDGYQPDGFLRREAHHAVRRLALVEIPVDVRSRSIDAACAHAASHGIVSVHECGGPDIGGELDFSMIMAQAARDDLVEIIGYWGELDGIARGRELGAFGIAGDLFVDGSLGSHTACLSEQYADASTTGAAYLEPSEIARHIVACTQAGVQAGFHVIGDAAAHRVIAAIELAVAECGLEQIRASGHRLEHVEMLAPEHLTVLSQCGVLVSMQPVFDELWGARGGMYEQRLGAARASYMNVFADIVRAGVGMAFGSDAPVTPMDPWRAVRAAMEHHQPTQRISARAAFAAHTRGGRRAAKQLDHGVLTAGASASFALWRVDEMDVVVPDGRLAAWSTDPRAGVAALPVLTESAPQCLLTVRDGVTIFRGR